MSTVPLDVAHASVLASRGGGGCPQFGEWWAAGAAATPEGVPQAAHVAASASLIKVQAPQLHAAAVAAAVAVAATESGGGGGGVFSFAARDLVSLIVHGASS